MQKMALRQRMKSSKEHKFQVDLMDGGEPGCEAFINRSFQSLRNLQDGIHNCDQEAVAQAAVEGMELLEHPMYRKICIMTQDQTIRTGGTDNVSSISSDSTASSDLKVSTVSTCHNDARIKSVKRVRFMLHDDTNSSRRGGSGCVNIVEPIST